eukprot:5795820-Prymnesium_polylepis.1
MFCPEKLFASQEIFTQDCDEKKAISTLSRRLCVTLHRGSRCTAAHRGHHEARECVVHRIRKVAHVPAALPSTVEERGGGVRIDDRDGRKVSKRVERDPVGLGHPHVVQPPKRARQRAVHRVSQRPDGGRQQIDHSREA